jgi:hypothetical protein
MPLIVDGITGVTFNDASLQGAAASPFGLKNRIINGDMVIDQRNNGASVTPANAQYTLDRWVFSVAQSSKLTAQQNAGSVTPPAGFTNYLGITSTSAYTVGSGENFNLVQRIEGFNTADLAWGTANARTVTLSFWVRSSLTGTFGGVLNNSSANRSYPFTYTISSANTWEYKTITIAGDTSGTWLTTNGIGIAIWFGLGVGSTLSGAAGSWSGSAFYSATGATSVVGTNGATFYITGVQLERNTTATPFEWIPYTTELQLCQRYLPATTAIGANEQGGQLLWISSTTGWGTFIPIVQPRVVPTGFTGTAAEITVRASASSNTVCSAVSFAGAGLSQFLFNVTIGSATGTANASGFWFLNTAGARILWTGCEL